MADFLRRLRAVNKATSMGLTSSSGPGSISRRFQTANSIDRSGGGRDRQSDSGGGANGAAGMGGSLAQALKEFQERKRKKS